MNKLLQLGFLLTGFCAFSQNGGLDPTFGTGGKVITSINSGADKAHGVALQQDGKIVVAGYTYSSVFGEDFACVRYNADGSLDTTFGTNGKVSFDLQGGSDDRAYSMDLQMDGKIVIAGYSDNGSDRAGAVIRLNTNGTLDTTFGTGGKAFTNFTIYNTAARADEFRVVKVHHVTGSIVVGGTSVLNTNESRGIFARYTASGILDTTFGNNGRLIDLPFPESNSNGFTFCIEDLALKSNGKITAVGWSDVPGNGSMQYSRQYVCRLNSNGTLDTTFSSDGFASNSFTTSDNKTNAMLLKPDDSFLFSGSSRWSSTDYKYYYGTVTASGTVALQGSIDFSPGTIDMCYDMGMDSNAKIILAGSAIDATTTTATSKFALTRLNTDYSIDTTFGTSGKVTTDFGTNTYSESLAMAIQSDDKIILVGYTGNDFAVARYIGNGTSLSTDGFKQNKSIVVYPNPVVDQLTIDTKNNELITGTAYQVYDSNGRIVINGKITNESTTVAVDNLAAGIYLLKVNQTTVKFVKK
ncbi:T9SS type A sorting domain-containing protein [Flavobacterium sp. WV_118_3]|uniref:T9SS type A sorting domain-containing protein n=1 Tax=Flavobacterium sp. WV_118_3 TaxID=3151764 RepID=UPI003218F2A8